MTNWFSPSAPQPPNPVQVAGAQTAGNISTAIANAFLNNVNQVTPQGSLNYDQTSTFTYTDPLDGKVYNIPRFTATQNLSPEQLNQQNLGDVSQTNLAQMAVGQSNALRNMWGGGFNADQYLAAYPDVAAYAKAAGRNPQDFAYEHYVTHGQNEGRTAGVSPGVNPTSFMANAPQGGKSDWINAVGYANPNIAYSGEQQTGFGPAGDITRTYGPDNFLSERQRIEDTLFARIDPQLQQDEARMRQQLADQGIRYGSQAYNDAWDNMTRQRTDARLGVTQTAGQEQQRLMDMAAKQAGFQNEAQMQAYQQLLGRSQFANTAQQQTFAQNAARLNAQNNAMVQDLGRQQALFNAANTQRNQYMQEQYQQRNQPLNEITALLSGSQVQNPQFLNTPTSQIPTTDIAGIMNNRFTQDMAIYNQQNQNFQQLMGGIFGAIGGLTRSDRTTKENISKVGSVFAAPGGGSVPKQLPIYSYSYKDDPSSTMHVGPMAQDVERIKPSAVTKRGGKKYIVNTKLGSILKAA